MDMTPSMLHTLFDHLPEAVFLLEGTQILYCNSSGQKLLPEDGAAAPYFINMLPPNSGDVLCTLKGILFHITVTNLDGQRLLIFRTMREPEPLDTAATIPAQLRTHLSNLSATTEHLAQQLARENRLETYADLLSIQTQASCRILRLAQQMEFAQEDLTLDFPHSTLNLVGICTALADELRTRLGEHGPHFHCRCEPPSLLLTGNRSLLEQLILSLLSNAIKSAGPEGSVELNLILSHGRAVLSVWDNGQSIPDDRLLQLFSPQSTVGLPRPNEGAGLDLWISHQIAHYHGGVIMAGNRQGGGTEFTISLPATPPKKLQFQSADETPQSDGFSPLLIALSDALPHQAYHPLEL